MANMKHYISLRPSPNSAELNCGMDQAEFMQYFELVPSVRRNRKSSQEVTCSNYDVLSLPSSSAYTPKSPITPRRKSLMSQLSRHHHPNVFATMENGILEQEQEQTSATDEVDSTSYQSRNVSSLLNIPLSSPLGLRLQRDIISVMDRGGGDDSAENRFSYEQFCRTPQKTLSDRLRDRGSIPITFRRRKCFGSHCHFYAFSSADKIEARKRYKTGLNAASRALYRSLDKCVVLLARLTPDQIKRLTRPRPRPVMIVPAYGTYLTTQQLQQMYEVGLNNQYVHGKSARKSLNSIMGKNVRRVNGGGSHNNSSQSKNNFRGGAASKNDNRRNGNLKHSASDVIKLSDSDDDVIITDVVPSKNGHVPQQSLQFRCHICDAEMTCYADFSNLVSGHFATAHGVHNISLVQEVDKTGQTVYSIVQNQAKAVSTGTQSKPTSGSSQPKPVSAAAASRQPKSALEYHLTSNSKPAAANSALANNNNSDALLSGSRGNSRATNNGVRANAPAARKTMRSAVANWPKNNLPLQPHHTATPVAMHKNGFANDEVICLD